MADFMARHWGSTRMAGHGRLFEIPELPGFLAERDGEWTGQVAYLIEGPALEVVWIGSVSGQEGVGSALLAECVQLARELHLARLWLVTTNDNLDALRFYQRRGFRVTALHREAVDDARRNLKPEIPLVGSFGIAMHDEIQLELPPPEWDDVVARYRWPAG